LFGLWRLRVDINNKLKALNFRRKGIAFATQRVVDTYDISLRSHWLLAISHIRLGQSRELYHVNIATGHHMAT